MNWKIKIGAVLLALYTIPAALSYLSKIPVILQNNIYTIGLSFGLMLTASAVILYFKSDYQ
ncbi:MAG: hypothetical protein ABEK04_03510 [Candidatus Nanohalobium sp.]